MSTDRIDKSIQLKAPRSRVWRALTDAASFGEWFGVKLDGPFEAGKRVRAQVKHEGYEHIAMELEVESIEPERLFSWRWHPHTIDPKIDYSGEPRTLVVFELSDAPGGTLLKVSESGFDRIPLFRRSEAYRGNENGWNIQMQAIERYVEPAKKS